MKRLFVLFILFLMIIYSQAYSYVGYERPNAHYMCPPYVRAGFRAGNDSYAGNHPDTAWATFEHGLGELSAGDTLFVMGGIYSNIQKSDYNMPSGTVNSPVVVKAWGDSVAFFHNPDETQGRSGKRYFTIVNDDYWVIDGVPFLNDADSLYLKFYADSAEEYEPPRRLFNLSGCEGFTIRGIEISGEGYYARSRNDAMIDVKELILFGEGCRRYLVEKNYFHHAFHPTGCWTNGEVLGDSTARSQGSGEVLWVKWNEYGIFRHNTIQRGNHSAMRVGGSRYMSFIQNFVDQHQGGLIYFVESVGGDSVSSYSLFDGNIFTNAGRSTSYLMLWPDWPTRCYTCDPDCYPKRKGHTVGGHHVTYRRNKMFTRHNHMLALTGEFNNNTQRQPRYNRIYNNTFYKGTCQSLHIQQDDDGHMWNNRIFNNIFYDADMERFDDYGGGDYPVIYIEDYQSNEGVRWINYPEQDPAYSNWGGNKFHNNLFERDSIASGPHYGRDHKMLMYGAYNNSIHPLWLFYSLNELEANDAVAWKDNIAGLPLLTTSDPENYGFKNKWYEIKANSPCVDAGRRVRGDFYDYNGIYVDSVMTANGDEPPTYMQNAYDVTTFGWPDTIPFIGIAPDIGAFELDPPTEADIIRNMIGTPRGLSDSLNLYFNPDSIHIMMYDSIGISASEVYKIYGDTIGINEIAVINSLRLYEIDPTASLEIVMYYYYNNVSSYYGEARTYADKSLNYDVDSYLQQQLIDYPLCYSNGDAVVIYLRNSSSSDDNIAYTMEITKYGTIDGSAIEGALYCTTPTISDLTDAPGETTCLIEWITPDLNGADHTVKYRELGDPGWLWKPYPPEVSVDTTHSVTLTELSIGTEYEYSVQSCGQGKSEAWCCSQMSDLDTFMTVCEVCTAEGCCADWSFVQNNYFEITVTITDCEVSWRYKQTNPVPGDWVTIDWDGVFSTGIHTANNVSTAASTTYEFQYRMRNKCEVMTNYVSCGEEATDGSNKFNGCP